MTLSPTSKDDIQVLVLTMISKTYPLPLLAYTSSRPSTLFLHSGISSTAVAVWACITPRNPVRHPVLLRRGRGIHLEQEMYFTPPCQPCRPTFGKLPIHIPYPDDIYFHFNPKQPVYRRNIRPPMRRRSFRLAFVYAVARRGKRGTCVEHCSPHRANTCLTCFRVTIYPLTHINSLRMDAGLYHFQASLTSNQAYSSAPLIPR